MSELLVMLKNWRAAYALDKAERELFDRIEAALRPSPSISEGEVEAACLGYWPLHWRDHIDESDKPSIRRNMANALEAASKTRATTEVRGEGSAADLAAGHYLLVR